MSALQSVMPVWPDVPGTMDARKPKVTQRTTPRALPPSEGRTRSPFVGTPGMGAAFTLDLPDLPSYPTGLERPLRRAFPLLGQERDRLGTAPSYRASMFTKALAHAGQSRIGYVMLGIVATEDDTEVTYQMGERYTPGADRGVRYDEPALGISWPLPVSFVAEKDIAWPLLS